MYLLVLLLLVALAGGTLAKYFRSRESEGTVRAKMFYFASDFMDGTERKLNPDVTEVSFTVSNYEDDLRYSEVDITYTVTVSPALPDGSISCSETKLNANGKDSATVTLKNMEPGQIYTVTVNAVGGGETVGGTTVGGYQKTLTGKIVVREESAVYTYLEDRGSYVLLTVWAQGYKGNVTIGYPAGVIPDNTDPRMAGVKTQTSGTGTFVDNVTFAGDSDASHSYRFFYSGTKPAVNQFPVTYSGTKTAAVRMPD